MHLAIAKFCLVASHRRAIRFYLPNRDVTLHYSMVF